MESDRRREVRFELPAQLMVRVRPTKNAAAEPKECRILNVSERGISFIHPHLIAVGTAVTLEHQGCEMLGVVRNFRLRGFGMQTECVAGVEITKVLTNEDVWKDVIKRGQNLLYFR